MNVLSPDGDLKPTVVFWHRAWFALAVGGALSILLIGRIVFSDFSILDDHNILSWLGTDNKLHGRDVWSTLMGTEIGQFGRGNRFRPAYWTQMITEAWLWGDNPTGYHVVQVVAFALFLSAVAWASFRSVGLIAGLAVIFLVANAKLWGDLWTYSFLPEQTVVLGLSLAIIGFAGMLERLLRDMKHPVGAWLVLFGAGCLLSAAGKENFIFLIAPYVIMFGLVLSRGRLSRAAILVGGTLLVLMLAVAYGVIVPNFGRPTDFYGFDNSISYRLKALSLSQLFPIAVLALAVGLATAAIAWRRIGIAENARNIMGAGLLLSGFGLYLAWEIFFYGGRLPTGIRHDFPSVILYTGMLSCLFYLIFVSTKRFFTSQWPGSVFLVGAMLLPGVAASFTYFPVIADVSYSNVRTAAMRADLNSSRQAADGSPSWPIIVRPTSAWDYEAVITLPIWFQKFHIRNPIAVAVDVPTESLKSPFERFLVNEMTKWSLSGYPRRFDRELSETAEARALGHCYEVAFGEPATRCVVLQYRPHSYLPN